MEKEALEKFIIKLKDKRDYLGNLGFEGFEKEYTEIIEVLEELNK